MILLQTATGIGTDNGFYIPVEVLSAHYLFYIQTARIEPIKKTDGFSRLFSIF